MKYRLALSFVIVVIVAIVAVYFSLSGRHQSSSVNAANVTQPASLPNVESSAVVVHSKSAVLRQPVSKSDANYTALYAKAVPMQTVINADYGWRIRHGYSLGMYSNYDDTTVERMAKNGDPLAQSAWFMRLNKGNSIDPPVSSQAQMSEIIERNYSLAKTAILNGVTNPNLVASYVFEDTRFMHSKPQGEESSSSVSNDMQKSQIRWAATAIFSEMRGDPSTSRGDNADVENSYRAGLTFLLSSQTGPQIGPSACKLARANYDQVQAERSAQGRGMFDDSPPEFVVGEGEPFPAATICQAEWPGPVPQCIQTWVQSPALVNGSLSVVAAWKCSAGGG